MSEKDTNAYALHECPVKREPILLALPPTSATCPWCKARPVVVMVKP